MGVTPYLGLTFHLNTIFGVFQMSVTYSKTNGLYKDGIYLKCFFKHDVETAALSAIRYDDGSVSVDFHDSQGIHFIDVSDNDVDFLLSCDDPEIAFNYAYSLIPPSENTDNKTADGVGVVTSEGEALSVVDCSHCGMQLGVTETPAKPMLCDDCLHDATVLGRVDKICKDCGYPDDYCICDTCADCGVITKLVGSHTQCPECYQRSKAKKPLETDVKLTESEINALLILVNTELDADDRIFELSELNAIRNKLLKASENFDLLSLLW